MNPLGKGVFNTVLAAVLLLSSVVGPCLTVEIVHSHEEAGHHCHARMSGSASLVHHHGDHHHHGHHHEEPEETGQDRDGSDPLSHTHHFCCGIDFPLASQESTPAPVGTCPATGRVGFRGDKCPEGPFFEVTKPPQLS